MVSFGHVTKMTVNIYKLTVFSLKPFVYLQFFYRSVISKFHQWDVSIAITRPKLTNQEAGIVLLHITRNYLPSIQSKCDCKIFRFLIGQFLSRDQNDSQYLQIDGIFFETFCLPIIFLSIGN